MSGVVTEADEATYVLWVTRVCQVAGLALVLYDHVITLDQEVKHIWKRFCLATVLFAIIRYIGDAAIITSTIAVMLPPQSDELCKVLVGLEGWLTLIGMFSIQAVLQIRIYALCRRSKRVLMFMLIFYIAEIATLNAFEIELIQGTEAVTVPSLVLSMCAGTHAYTRWFAAMFTVLCFEGLLFITLLWVTVRYRFGSRGFFGRSLFETLVRGNVFYFACVLSSCLFNVIVGKTLGEDWLGMPTTLTNAIEVVAGCRLILSLHAAIFRDTLSDG